MSAPEVSVVIPTRNRVDRLQRAALRSALGQADVSVEVLVVDDGSTDGTAERLSALPEPRLRVIRLDTNRGVAHARNAGIAAAQGRWVAFLDDDDLWAPQKLRAQLDAAAAAAAGFAYAGVVSVDEHASVRYAFAVPDPAELPRRLLAGSALPAGCSNVVVRTDLVRAVGGFDERLFQLSDWDLWIRLAWAAPAAACREPLVGYVEHDENMLLSDPRDVMHELAYIAEKHAAARAEHGVALDRRGFAHWVAWGHLRRRRRLRAARVFLRSGLTSRRLADVGLALAFVLRALVPLGFVRRSVPSSAPPAADPAWLGRYR